MANLFVYGTLCFPEIVEKLTGKSFRSAKAILKGFQRRSVKNADYPAIIVNSNSEVEGILLHDVDELSMKILSFYEGEDYWCEVVDVQIETDFIKANVFVWNSAINGLEEYDWNQEEFVLNSLQIYIEKIAPATFGEFNQN